MNIKLDKDALLNKTVLITGAGGGIGLEAAKAFVAMGAKVFIVEVNKEKGTEAAEFINGQYPNKAIFFNVDLADETAVKKLCDEIISKYGCPNILFNNAATVVTGEIGEVTVSDWDYSYAVNLKAPFLLTTLLLKPMKEKNNGCIVFVSSSGAAPYLGAYETFKTAQVEFSNTLSMELDGTHIFTYTIAPGLVRTATAEKSIKNVAASMGMTTDEFYMQNESHILNVIDAGRGFAVSVLKAGEYHGQEISSIQALNDFQGYTENTSADYDKDTDCLSKIELLDKITSAFFAQYDGWQSRNIFEKQWVLRDFKKSVGMSADAVQKEFIQIKERIEHNEELTISIKLFEKLLHYWEHQLKLLQGFEKDKERLAEYSQAIREWIFDIQTLLTFI